MTPFEAVHALALRRKSDLVALQASTGADASALEAALAHSVAEGHVIPARGLYVLAPKGATWLQERYPEEFSEQRADALLIAEYERFEVINRELKTLITQWQSMSVGGKQMPNDHSDASHDSRILDRLANLQERAEVLLARMAARLPRLGRYATRLGDALDRALNGEHEWVSGIRCDSYHTVWFEMHEDLLRLLGLKREE